MGPRGLPSVFVRVFTGFLVLSIFSGEGPRGPPWAPVVSRGPPWPPVGPRGLPWAPVVSRLWAPVVSRGAPWSPVGFFA